MLEKNRLTRKNRLEQEIAVLAYEYLQLSRGIEASQQRIREIESAVAQLEGGLSELEKYRRDIATAEAVAKAKAGVINPEGAMTLDQLGQAIGADSVELVTHEGG